MKEALEKMASGLIMEMVTKADGVDLVDVDHIVTQVVREMGMVVIMDQKRWPNGSGLKLRVVVTAELARLLRRGRLTVECDRPFLYLKPQPETLKLVRPRS